MKTIETLHQFVFQSKDDNGTFEFRVHKDCRQIQLETEMDGFSNESFIDINKQELTAIRDMINLALNDKKE